MLLKITEEQVKFTGEICRARSQDLGSAPRPPVDHLRSLVEFGPGIRQEYHPVGPRYHFSS